MAALFFKSLIIGYSGAIMPGSMFTYTVDKSLKNGTKAGFLASLGHALLELVLVILIFAGAGRFLSTKTAQIIIGLAGGAVLAFLGFSMIRDVLKNRISLDIKGTNNNRQDNIFWAGAILSASNPYFIVWWSAVGLSLITSSYKSFGIAGVTVFYIGHILADLSWYTLVAFLVSKTRHLMKLSVYKGIIVILAICLIGFSVSFIWGSISNIISL